MKQRIAKEYDCPHSHHRGDFEICPHCGKKFEANTWDKQAKILVLGIVSCKHDSVTVVSECPECFEESWVHHSRLWGDCWSEDWKKKAHEEIKKRELTAARDWCRAICGKCLNLKEAMVSTHAWRQCTIGLGPAEKKCKSFKKDNYD